MSTTEENELICEKLLGWHQCLPGSKGHTNGYAWQESRETPTHLTWAEAGLILEALQSAPDGGPKMCALQAVQYELGFCKLTPAAIRAAALAYLGAQK